MIKVAGRQMQQDFEPVLERQIHYFVNGASGVQHVGQRDIAWIRISKTLLKRASISNRFGKILIARFHADFGAIVDKVQVTIVHRPALHTEVAGEGRRPMISATTALADLTDNKVEEYYSCTLCQSFAPNHVCSRQPGTPRPVRRLQLAGLQGFLQHQSPPVPTSRSSWADRSTPVKGYWEGTNEYRCGRVARRGPGSLDVLRSWKTR